MADSCPLCNSRNIEQDVYSPERIYDGQGYESTLIYYYTCNNCGCEFEEEIISTVKINIIKRRCNFANC